MVATASTEHFYWLALTFAVCYVNISRNKRKRQPIGMLGRSSGNHDWLLPTQTLAFLAVFVYATQAITFEWKPGLSLYTAFIDNTLHKCIRMDSIVLRNPLQLKFRQSIEYHKISLCSSINR